MKRNPIKISLALLALLLLIPSVSEAQVRLPKFGEKVRLRKENEDLRFRIDSLQDIIEEFR